MRRKCLDGSECSSAPREGTGKEWGVLLAACCSLLIVHTSPAFCQPASGDTLRQSFTQLPLHFEANEGQLHPRVKFVARGAGYDVFLTPNETVLSLEGTTADKRGAVVRMQLVGANPGSAVTGREKQPGVISYFIGRDRARWRANVATYAKVHYADVYKGVDAIYYGNRQQLEYDLVVSPGIDPHVITLRFDGSDAIELDKNGDLVLRAAGIDMRLRKPFIYQHVDGKRKQIAGGYALVEQVPDRNPAAGDSPPAAPRTPYVTFNVGDYDSGLPLVIDPVLVVAYSSLLGGSEPAGAWTSGKGIAVDGSGNAYVVGYTTTTNFPVENPLQATLLGGTDAFIAKFDPSGSSLLYATYFGGSIGGGTGEFGGPPITIATGVAVDATGSAYVTGGTTATDLAIVNGFQPTHGGGFDAFVVQVNDTGSTLLRRGSRRSPGPPASTKARSAPGLDDSPTPDTWP